MIKSLLLLVCVLACDKPVDKPSAQSQLAQPSAPVSAASVLASVAPVASVAPSASTSASASASASGDTRRHAVAHEATEAELKEIEALGHTALQRMDVPANELSAGVTQRRDAGH